MLDVVYEMVDKFSEITITLVRYQTAGYHLDNNGVEGNDQQELYKMMMHNLEQVQRAYNAYRATLGYRNLVEYINSTIIGRRYLQCFCHWPTKGVEEGTFPHSPLRDDGLGQFLFC